MARNAYRPIGARLTTPAPGLRRAAAVAVAGLALLGGVAGCNARTPGSTAPQRSAGHHGASTSADPTPSAAHSSARADGGGAGGQTQLVQLNATQQMRFQPSKVEVHPGRVTVRLHNTGSMPHQWQVKGIDGAEIAIVAGGETQSVTFSVPRTGSFRMECSWHAQHGMYGTFLVRGGHS
ncbi:plastocyanin/azurin family copper-binding protein [Actinocatenispora sera]|uniref:cupredoxin domain-containing protein n=1 Tax=Actinocatenispora sera TaxID=390989 RepID=UPI0033C6B07C